MTGLIRSLDGLGRIVIPSEYRKEMNWESGQEFGILLEKNGSLSLSPQLSNTQEDLLKTLEDAKDYVDGGREPQLEERLGEAINKLKGGE